MGTRLLSSNGNRRVLPPAWDENDPGSSQRDQEVCGRRRNGGRDTGWMVRRAMGPTENVGRARRACHTLRPRPPIDPEGLDPRRRRSGQGDDAVGIRQGIAPA